MNPIQKVGYSEALSVFVAAMSGLFGFLVYGLIAVFYVGSIFLAYVIGWVVRQLVLEYWATLHYRYQINREFSEWSKRNNERRYKEWL